MKALLKNGAGPGLELAEVAVPQPRADEVRVRVLANSICGTDLHILHWDPWAAGRLHPPLIVGHELCGIVDAVGAEVTTPRVGTYVAAESHIICGRCYFCRTGRGHICQSTQILGVDRDGAFAEYVTFPAVNAWPLPEAMPREIGTLQENFGNAVHTAFAVNMAARKVLVTGCGPVGLMAILVARACGARLVFATDVSDYRLRLADTLGATATFNAAREDIVTQVLTSTEGEGIDVLLEMSGAPSAIEEGFRVLKHGGEVALLGVPSEPMRFDLAGDVIFRGATVKGIVGRRLWETWYQATGLQRSGAVDLSALVTHTFPIAEHAAAFRQMESGDSGKVVLLWDE